MTCWQVLALADKEHTQNAVSLLSQRKANGVGMALSREPAAGLGVAQVATRFQLFVVGSYAFVTGSGAGSRPSRAQRKALRKRPV